MKNFFIFYVFESFQDQSRGSGVRPIRMLSALKGLGLEAIIIDGTAKERAEKIRSLPPLDQVSFCYLETSSLPVFATEPKLKVLLTRPCVDFRFFSKLKKHGIPLGAFYRDCYWRFPKLYKNWSPLKVFVFYWLYLIEYFLLSRVCSVLFLPHIKMQKALPLFPFQKVVALPAGMQRLKIRTAGSESKVLRILYVGGLGPIYKMHELFRAIKNCEGTELLFCVRGPEWERVRKEYEIDICSRVRVFHCSGGELQTLFEEADLAACVFEPHPYRDFAMPVKMFEYLENFLPIIATKNSAVGAFVQEQEVGWAVEYDHKVLEKLFVRILSAKDEIDERRLNINRIFIQNSWQQRANLVYDLLGQRS